MTRDVTDLMDRGIPILKALGTGITALAGARVGAVAQKRLPDYRNLCEERVLRFRERAAKIGETPVRDGAC